MLIKQPSIISLLTLSKWAIKFNPYMLRIRAKTWGNVIDKRINGQPTSIVCY